MSNVSTAIVHHLRSNIFSAYKRSNSFADNSRIVGSVSDLITRVSDPHLFNADPDAEPALFLLRIPDPGPFCEFSSNFFRELLK